MTHDWHIGKFSDILEPVSRPVQVEADKIYRNLGVQWYAKGLFIREEKPGHEIRAKELYQVEIGDLVYNRLFAWKGSFAIAEKDTAGGFVSGEFPCFRVNTKRANAKYLHLYLSQEKIWKEIERTSTGQTSISRLRLKEPVFLGMEIPLPPLEEQDRIVERVEALAVRITEAKSLREEAGKETEAFLASVRHRACTGELSVDWRIHNKDILPTANLLEHIASQSWEGHAPSRKRSPMSLPQPPQIPETWVTITFGELQEIGAILDIQDGNHGGDYPRQNEFSERGIPFVTAKQMQESSVDILGAPRLPKERAERLRIGFAKGGDVLISHNASVGKVVRAPVDAADFLLGTSATYYRCNTQAVDPNYLVHFMKSDLFQYQLQWIMKQTTRNQVSVLKQVNLWICLPPIEEQRYLAEYLDSVQARLASLRELQSATGEELDALLPSVLDKAFKGEL